MRTKEVEVKLHKVYTDGRNEFDLVHYVKADSDEEYLNAKLIIELPENKIEITESEIDSALRLNGYGSDSILTKTLKQQLGF